MFHKASQSIHDADSRSGRIGRGYKSYIDEVPYGQTLSRRVNGSHFFFAILSSSHNILNLAIF